MTHPLKPSIVRTHKDYFLKAYSILYKVYGPQHWWPAKTKFEVIVGAILTQSTNWSNVEKAIINLHREKLLAADKLHDLSVEKLALLIRSSGYYNQKAIKLKNFLNYFFKEYDGNLNKMSRRPLAELRGELLEIKGIGPETADSILLYALDKPIFVVDAYTKRILVSSRLIDEKATYQTIQELFMQSLPEDVKLFNEYHALIVRTGKEHYRGESVSGNSPLQQLVYQ